MAGPRVSDSPAGWGSVWLVSRSHRDGPPKRGVWRG